MYRSLFILLLYYLHENKGAAAMDCNKQYKQTSGRINAFNMGNMDCNYEINTDPQHWLRLRWEKFDVSGGKMPDCYDGSVVVYTGCSNRRKVATFCSKNLRTKPHNIYSPDNCIKIMFSNRNGKSRGFTANWKSFSYSTTAQFPGITCSYGAQKLTTKSVVVGSPGWPSQYRDKTCKWTFRTGDSGLQYVYNIMDVDMYKSQYWGCDTSFSDHMYVKGEKSQTTKVQSKWYYCKDNIDTNEFQTQYHEIDVGMRIRHDKDPLGYRGFVIGLVAYEDDVSRGFSSWGSLIGGIIVGIIVVIVIACCYRRHRRRQSTEGTPLVTDTQVQVASVVALPPPDSYPHQQPAGYPPPPADGYTQQPNVPAGGYGPPPPGVYPAPPVYTENPQEYQPPSYYPPQGATGSPYPPPAADSAGGYPSAPYPPQGGYPTQYPPPQ